MRSYNREIRIGSQLVGLSHPSFFIADIAANHDGDLERAKDLIWKAKEAGADAAKFQHFRAKDIVSDVGFRALGAQLGHQSAWKGSVFQIYEKYSLNRDWDQALVETCHAANIQFMTSPYDFAAIESASKIVTALKIGSGDITWLAAIEHISKQGKPVLLACGASSAAEVEQAVAMITAHTPEVVLMQCNTNYSGNLENFRYVNLRVLDTFARRWPGMILGLSDHTSGHATVLGAVALGARVIEKHFTDDNGREGPDHGFAMNPVTWREMVDRTRELETAFGDGIKRVEANERETVVLQRRCLRLTRDLPLNHVLRPEDLEALRPAPQNALQPYDLPRVIGRKLLASKVAGEALLATDVAEIR